MLCLNFTGEPLHAAVREERPASDHFFGDLPQPGCVYADRRPEPATHGHQHLRARGSVLRRIRSGGRWHSMAPSCCCPNGGARCPAGQAELTGLRPFESRQCSFRAALLVLFHKLHHEGRRLMRNQDLSQDLFLKLLKFNFSIPYTGTPCCHALEVLCTKTQHLAFFFIILEAAFWMPRINSRHRLLSHKFRRNVVRTQIRTKNWTELMFSCITMYCMYHVEWFYVSRHGLARTLILPNF